MSLFRPFLRKKVLSLLLPLSMLLVGAWCALAQSSTAPGAGPAIGAPAAPPNSPISSLFRANGAAPQSRAYYAPATSVSAAPETDPPAKTTASSPAPGNGPAKAAHGPAVSSKTLPVHAGPRPPKNWIDQSPEEAKRKSAGCVECHTQTDAHTMWCWVAPTVTEGIRAKVSPSSTPMFTLGILNFGKVQPTRPTPM